MNAADVDAAGERKLSIDHQHLAVIAVIGLQDAETAAQRTQRVEFAHPHAALAQALEVFPWCRERADGIADKVHLDPFGSLAQQRVPEPQSDLVGLDDVALERDAVTGLSSSANIAANVAGPSTSSSTLLPRLRISFFALKDRQMPVELPCPSFGPHCTQRSGAFALLIRPSPSRVVVVAIRGGGCKRPA